MNLDGWIQSRIDSTTLRDRMRGVRMAESGTALNALEREHLSVQHVALPCGSKGYC